MDLVWLVEGSFGDLGSGRGLLWRLPFWLTVTILVDKVLVVMGLPVYSDGFLIVSSILLPVLLFIYIRVGSRYLYRFLPVVIESLFTGESVLDVAKRSRNKGLIIISVIFVFIQLLLIVVFINVVDLIGYSVTDESFTKPFIDETYLLIPIAFFSTSLLVIRRSMRRGIVDYIPIDNLDSVEYLLSRGIDNLEILRGEMDSIITFTLSSIIEVLSTPIMVTKPFIGLTVIHSSLPNIIQRTRNLYRVTGPEKPGYIDIYRVYRRSDDNPEPVMIIPIRGNKNIVIGEPRLVREFWRLVTRKKNRGTTGR